MLAKSILAGTILTAAAGAFVYFGTDNVTQEFKLPSQGQNTVESEREKTRIINRKASADEDVALRRDQDAQSNVVSDTVYEDTTDTESATGADDAPDSDIIDNGRDVSAGSASDTASYIVKDPEAASMDEPVAEIIDTHVNAYLQSAGDLETPEDMAVASKDLIEIILTQAELIQDQDLKDRAFLDVVTYAINSGNYIFAEDVLSNIGQVELRDTARNRIAIAYAFDQKADEAFAMIDKLEVGALKDIIRLQIIEALITPEQLPQELR